jgi:hypothetical protein
VIVIRSPTGKQKNDSEHYEQISPPAHGHGLPRSLPRRTEYIRQQFGMDYTQDESYYLLDAGEDGSVYLGLKTGIDREAMARELRLAQEGGPSFHAETYVNKFPAKKHDHFLIPAGADLSLRERRTRHPSA